MKLNENFVFKLKSLCDIYSIFSSYVELSHCGSNMRCCCPFHVEKTPSCFVYSKTQSFYCFGCGVGGDVITFIEKIENLSYLEAVSFLAKKVNLSLPNRFEYSYSDVEKLKERLFQINRIAALFFHNSLFSSVGVGGLNYFKFRGLTKKTIVKFGLGFSQNNWNSLFNHLKLKGFTTAEMVDSGLVLKSKTGKFYDKFRNRIMFPIVGLNGRVLGFGGRTLSTSGPKYLNSSDSVIFKKGFELYGLNLEKKAYSKKGSLILCEGYMDVISLHQNGFFNAVATLGTALTKQQVLLIKRSATDVLIAYDSDEAGQAAIARACDLFEQARVKTRVLSLKKAKDPDEFLQKYGAASFKNLLNGAASFEHLFFEKMKHVFKTSNSEEKRVRLHELCNLISKMNDPLRREVYLSKVCSEFELNKSVVAGHISYLIKKRKLKNKAKFKEKVFNTGVSLNDEQILRSSVNLKLIRAQEGLIRIIFNRPEFIKNFVESFNFDWLSVGFYKKVFNFFVECFNKGVSFSYSGFRQILNEEEFARLSKILNEGEVFTNVFESFNNYIKILNDEFVRKSENVLKMSSLELELKRQKNAELKS